MSLYFFSVDENMKAGRGDVLVCEESIYGCEAREISGSIISLDHGQGMKHDLNFGSLDRRRLWKDDEKSSISFSLEVHAVNKLLLISENGFG